MNNNEEQPEVISIDPIAQVGFKLYRYKEVDGYRLRATYREKTREFVLARRFITDAYKAAVDWGFTQSLNDLKEVVLKDVLKYYEVEDGHNRTR